MRARDHLLQHERGEGHSLAVHVHRAAGLAASQVRRCAVGRELDRGRRELEEARVYR